MKKTKKQGNNYFTTETEDAIVRYNNEDNHLLKNRIYENYIHYPLFKLTQNIIHTFKFYHTEVEDLEHLQHELIIFILSKMHLFDPAKSVDKKIATIIIENKYNIPDMSFREYLLDKGLNNQAFELSNVKDYIELLDINETDKKEMIKVVNIPKAYSYFGTIVKRWLILYNNKNYNIKVQSISINSHSEDDSQEYLEDNLGIESESESYNDGLEYFIEYFTEQCTINLEKLFTKKQDIQIADAILEIFRNRQNIDIFNKKALYIYIREIIDVKTPKITKVANRLYEIFKFNYSFYLENDYIDFKFNIYK